jgi:hypothetical protein
MFLSLENKINKMDFNKSFFPKMGNKSLSSFYNSLIKNIKLKDILSKKETEYILYIPSTPRYFISASKKKLNRSSIKKIYFNTIEDLNKVYILLNSNIMYWWWRIMDGGMSLSMKTILSLPLLNINPKTKDFNDMIKLLEESEEKNIIKTLNANKINENIKHSKEVIDKINNFLLENKIIKEIEKYHKNDYF